MIGLGEEVFIDFLDALSRKVMSGTLKEAESSIDVSKFPQCVYFVSVQMQERERLIRKVVVY